MSAVTLMLAIYVVLDGFDFGVGILYPFRGADRRGSTVWPWLRSDRSGTATKCG